MDAKEYTGWHHGTSKQHAAPLRKSKKKTREKKQKIGTLSTHAIRIPFSQFFIPPRALRE